MIAQFKSHRLVIVFLLALCVFWSVYTSGSPYLVSNAAGLWTNVSHISTNAYFTWHLGFLYNSFATALLAALYLMLYSTLRNLSISTLATMAVAIAMIAHSLGRDFLIFTGLLSTLICFNLLKSENLKQPLISTIGGLFCFILCGPTAIYWVFFPYFTLQLSDKSLKKNILINFFFLILPIIILSLIYPIPDFPEYPEGASLVIDDGLDGLLRPYWGLTIPNLQIVDRLAEKSSYTTIMLILSPLVFLTALEKKKVIFAVPFLIVCADIFLQEEIAQIMPLAVFRRILPYSSLMPLISIFVAFVIFQLASCSKSFTLTALLNITLLSLLAFPPANLMQQDISTTEPSPSLNIERTTLKKIRAQLPVSDDTSISPKSYLISTNLNGNVEKIRDRRDRSKISSRAQTGNEYVTIQFENQQTISGVTLSTGHYPTDFARKLDIIDCANPEKEKVIVENILWLGNVKKLANDSIYYQNQSNKIQKILFRNKITTNCLSIRQIGEEPYFDWSIAELRILEPKPTRSEE